MYTSSGILDEDSPELLEVAVLVLVEHTVFIYTQHDEVTVGGHLDDVVALKDEAFEGAESCLDPFAVVADDLLRH